jgi:hypothetical protein
MAKRKPIPMQKRTQKFFDRDLFNMSDAEFEQTLQRGNGIFWNYNPITEEIQFYDEETVAARLRVMQHLT